MSTYNIGDIVVRKSHNQDIYFKVVDILNRDSGKPIYLLTGMFYRILADASEDDLIKMDLAVVRPTLQREIMMAKRNTFRGNSVSRFFLFNRVRRRSGKILQIDSSERFLEMCRDHYKEAGLLSVGIVADENKQPELVMRALKNNRPDILVITGHDGIKKDSGNLNSIDNYRNSKYFIECVREARSYEPDKDKLCIFAGACQSYFEGIMNAGANFASSPGRININALDPAIVSEKVALTDRRYFVTPQEIAKITITGAEGVGGIRTRGHLY
ncbi:MAG: sporulation peptidase YabG [Clostridiaceae bacterium]|nr:sporulation peptidase YabG [Clostridiaceae bacterium]